RATYRRRDPVLATRVPGLSPRRGRPAGARGTGRRPAWRARRSAGGDGTLDLAGHLAHRRPDLLRQLPALHLQVLEAEDAEAHRRVQRVLDRGAEVVEREAGHASPTLPVAGRVRGLGSSLSYRPRSVDPVAQPRTPPPVVAVLAVHDPPGEQLDQVVAALAAQDHPNLDVLVVVTGPDDPTERVRAVLPAARIHRVDGNPGFGTAANVVLDIVSGAEFFVFCHDDAAPDP